MDSVVFRYQSNNRLTTVLADEYGAPVTDAVVTVTVVNENQEALSGVSWPQQMLNPIKLPPIPLIGPDPTLGQTYTVILPPELDVRSNEPAYALITAVSPTVGTRNLKRLIVTRKD